MEWTRSETLKFINLFERFPCLWNSKNKDYRNRQIRRDALEYLAQEANTDVKSVEKKIISLRGQYNREIHKIKAKSSEAGLDEEPISCWYAFDQMHFLKDHINHKPSTADPLTITFTQHQKEDADPYDSSHTSTNLSTDNINEQFPTRQPPRRCKIRKTGSQLNTLNLLRHASNAIINKHKKDDFSIFGESVANELREIKSKKEILELKKNIMNLIYITKINILDAAETTSLSHHPNSRAHLIDKENICGSSDVNLFVGKIEMVVDGQCMEEDAQEI